MLRRRSVINLINSLADTYEADARRCKRKCENMQEINDEYIFNDAIAMVSKQHAEQLRDLADVFEIL